MENKKGLILVGGGGHCRSVAAAAEAVGLKVTGVLDPAHDPGDKIGNLTILGNDDDAGNFIDDNKFVVTVGAIGVPSLRNRVISGMERIGVEFGKVIAPTAFVASDAEIGAGTVVLNQAVVNANAKVGRHVIINTGAIIEHDAIVGDNTHVSTRAVVNGGCSIGKECFIGSGVVVMHGVKIGDRVVVGAGSTVSRDLTEPGTYLGFPARKIKTNE